VEHIPAIWQERIGNGRLRRYLWSFAGGAILLFGARLAGSFRIRAMHTPGHTPAHMSWQIEDALFVGDTLFIPDYGTARCDFPGGSAEELFDSIQRIYALAD
jgi:glyoxylase-like metal-dependent hydrolase (beta-lactamase superfamily II)